MKTPQQIEEMVGKYKPENYYKCLNRDDLEFIEKNGEKFVSLEEVRRAVYCASEKAYIAGAAQMQKDLLESASEGFDDCFSKYATESNLHHEFDAHYFWQACALSKMKEIQELKEENERLRVNLNTCKNDYWFMTNLLEKYSTDKEQAIKDCIERMKFRKLLFKQESKE